jgi:2-polyprenyl-3-methyl-5-hydroxy-6-metoxy-1,4-benzoquinol methylase
MNYRKFLFEKYNSTAQSSLFEISLDSYRVRYKAFLKKFKKILPEDKTSSILDIGCGMGYFLWFLQNLGFTNTVGIDLSPEQIQVANSFGVKNIYLYHWRDYLQDRSSSFDFIMLDNVIEHLTKDEIIDILQLIFTALKPGGKLYISTPNTGSPFGIPLSFIDFTHEVFFTSASLEQVLKVVGYNPIHVFGEPLIAFDILSFVRKIAFLLIAIPLKLIYSIGTGGGGRTSISHNLEPSLGAIAEKPSN